MSELNMRYIQKRFKNIIPISRFLNRYYSGSNNLILPPLIDIKDSKWNNFAARDMPELNNYNGVRIILQVHQPRKTYLVIW